MGRSIAIVGSGAAELVLGFALLSRGHSVTLVSSRTPEQIARGPLRLPGALFRAGQRLERDLGIQYWDDDAYYGREIVFDLRDESGERILRAVGGFHAGVAAVVDPRFEHSVWLDELERRGARVVHAALATRDLDTLAALHDRVFVGEPHAELFEIDPERTFPRLPDRTLAAIVVEREWDRQDWQVSFVPGIGEIAGVPLLSASGTEARAVFVRGVPGSPLDLARFADADGPTVLAAIGRVLARFRPEEAAALAEHSLVDAEAYRIFDASPVARHPLARLPSGRFVVGVGGAFVSLAPITGHALTPLVTSAKILSDAISDPTSEALDEDWALRVSDEVFRELRSAYDLEGALLVRPPHVLDVLRAASRRRDIADDLATACADPGAARWLYSPSSARARLGSALPRGNASPLAAAS